MTVPTPPYENINTPTDIPEDNMKASLAHTLNRTLLSHLLRRKWYVSPDGRFEVSARRGKPHAFVLDALTGRRLDFELRSMKDRYTVREVFALPAYHFSHLQRRDEIYAFRARAGDRERLIIDCGANIGASPLLFSSLFPGAKIAALEPDEGNCKVHRVNCRNEDVELFHGAIGPEDGVAYLQADANPRSHTVSGDGDVKVDVLSVPTLLDRFRDFTPFIIKIDVEGYESELFARNTDWISRFPVMVIELHDWKFPRRALSKAFIEAHAGLDRDLVLDGENLISLSNAAWNELP